MPGYHRFEAIELIGFGEPLQLFTLDARQRLLCGREGARIQIGDGRIAAHREHVRCGWVQCVEQPDAEPAIVV